MFRIKNSYEYKRNYFKKYFLKEYQCRLMPYLINAYRNTKTQMGKCSIVYSTETLGFIDGTNPYIAGFYQNPWPHKRYLCSNKNSSLTGKRRRHILL